MDQTTSIDPRVFGANPALRGSQPDERQDAAKIREVALQFESMLLAHMLRELQPAMSGEDEDSDNSFNLGPLSDVMSVELSLALSRAGGMGLADSLSRALSRQTQGSGDAGSMRGLLSMPEAIVAPETPTVGAPDVAPVAEPLASWSPRISSAFGWRTDPINGQSRFHHGTDVPLVKGHEVRAAADGMVTSVTGRSGYGLMVVVAHENGVETRYAHLSAADVRVGDAVTRGGVIARAGNSGRSTGPHLHFEVREGGQPVDPRAWLEAVVAPPA